MVVPLYYLYFVEGEEQWCSMYVLKTKLQDVVCVASCEVKGKNRQEYICKNHADVSLPRRPFAPRLAMCANIFFSCQLGSGGVDHDGDKITTAISPTTMGLRTSSRRSSAPCTGCTPCSPTRYVHTHTYIFIFVFKHFFLPFLFLQAVSADLFMRGTLALM